MFQSKSHQLKLKLRSINNNESLNREKLTELKAKLDKYQSERNELSKCLKSCLATAQEKGDRVDTGETLEEIKDRIAKIKAQLKNGIPVNLDPQEIRELIATKTGALEADQGTFENLKLSINMVNMIKHFSLVFYCYKMFFLLFL